MIDFSIIILLVVLDLSELLILPYELFYFSFGVVSILLILFFYDSVFVDVFDHCFLVGFEGFELLLVGGEDVFCWFLETHGGLGVFGLADY